MSYSHGADEPNPGGQHGHELGGALGEVAFDAIVDYESFGGWQNAVDRVEVIDRTPEGVGRTVELFVDAKIRKIDYVLRWLYAPTRIEWDFVEGNGMRYMDGTYTFEELGPGRTRATYNLGADPEIPVPGMVLRRTHKQLVKRSVEDLKREAERRAAAVAGAEAGSQAPPPEAAPETEAAPPAPAAPEAARTPRPRRDRSPRRAGARPVAGERRRARPRPATGCRSGREAGPGAPERGGPPSTLPAEELAERAAAAAGQALRIGRGLAAGASAPASRPAVRLPSGSTAGSADASRTSHARPSHRRPPSGRRRRMPW